MYESDLRNVKKMKYSTARMRFMFFEENDLKRVLMKLQESCFKYQRSASRQGWKDSLSMPVHIKL